MRRIGRSFPILVLISLLVPTLAGFVVHGFTLEGLCAVSCGAAWCGSSSCTTSPGR